MAAGVTLLTAAADFSISELVTRAGALAAVAATIGLLLVLPLYLTQRREVRRLLEWQQREPERGDSGSQAPAAPAPAAPGVAVPRVPQTGPLTPAERVTADRPALERITTERPALTSPSFWSKLIARGPRHPLVISGVALLVGVAAVAAVALTGPGRGEEAAQGSNLDRSAIGVVVLNGSSQTALAGKVADSLAADGFTDVRTGTTGTSRQTVVLFARQRRREATAVSRRLGVKVIQPLDRPLRAVAPEADVVVVAGEDRARG
jgi:hypothetical protein